MRKIQCICLKLIMLLITELALSLKVSKTSSNIVVHSLCGLEIKVVYDYLLMCYQLNKMLCPGTCIGSGSWTRSVIKWS